MKKVDAVELVRRANPIPDIALEAGDTRRANDLLARLHDGETLPGGRIDDRLPPRRRIAVAAVATAALIVGVGVAVAEDVPPFGDIAAFVGLGSAQRSQTDQDRLAASIIDRLNEDNARVGSLSPGTLDPSTSRLVAALPSGRMVYVLSTSKGELCTVLLDRSGPLLVSSYGDPLSQIRPVTVTTFDQVVNGPNATPPISYGLAKDGIAAVSFTAAGREQTVPVVHNVWAYEGTNGALDSITVHYSNGDVQTINS